MPPTSTPESQAGRRDWRHAAGLAAVGLLGGCALSWLAWRSEAGKERDAAREVWYARLTAMADDRRAAIDRWLSEDLANARLVAASPATRVLVEASARAAPPQAKRDPPADLVEQLKAAHGYRAVRVFDARGRVLLGAAEALPDDGCVQLARLAARTRRGVAGFHTSPTLDVVLGLAEPVLQGEVAGALGAVSIEVDPKRFLYPFLASQPLPTATGETVLVDRDGDFAVYLSPLRHQAGPPLTVRRSLNEPRLAARDALGGEDGVGAFLDHRGVDVLAATRRLRAGPWGLIVKIDRAEAFAHVGARARQHAAAALGLYLAAWGLGFGVWRQQRASYQSAVSRSRARLAELIEEASDAILVVEPGGRIRDASRQAERLYGYAGEQLLRMTVDELFPESSRGKARLMEHAAGAGSLFEAAHVRSDGEALAVEIGTRLVSLGGKDAFVSIVRDIRERKVVEDRAQRLNRMLRALSAVHELITRDNDWNRILAGVCRIVVEQGGIRSAWIGFAAPETGQVHAVARAGTGAAPQGELASLGDGLAPDPDPAILAVREGRLVTVPDIGEGEAGSPWRETARLHGCRSGASAPIHVAGRVAGVLSVFADRSQAFEGEIGGLLEQLAADLGRALESLEARQRRERAERALALSESRLARAQALGGLGTWSWQAGTDSLWWSSEIYRITGVPPEGFVPTRESCLELIHPEDAEGLRVFLKQLVRDGGTASHELRLRRPDGTERRIAGTVEVVQDADGGPAELLGIVLDVTERRRSEQALRESERKLRQQLAEMDQIYRYAPVGLFVADRALRIQRINERMAAMHGRPPEQQIGRELGELVPDLAPSLRRLLQPVLERGEPALDVELRGEAYGQPGVERDWLASYFPLLDDAGRPAGVVGAVLDITERKAAAKVLTDTREQLFRAQKVEAIGHLAGGVAHDFNNILNVILGYAELGMRRMSEDHPQRRNLAEIRKAAERAAGLTRQLLAFGRRQLLQPRVLDLNEVVADMDKMLRRLIGEDIELRVRAEQPLGRVMADPGQMEQVLMNLAVNARDAMPRGGTLTIRTENVGLEASSPFASGFLTPGDYIRLSVSDDGEGMSGEVQERIFEPFFTTKQQGKGTGLGLSTVYGIVKQSGGSILVDSQLGVGTTFAIYLPRIDASPEPRPQPAPEQEVVASGSGTVLVVEDNDAVRELTVELLEAAGFRVLAAAGGEDALGLVEREAGVIDLLLTDVVMPRMSGRELAERVVALRPGIRVVYTSGYADDAVVRHGIQAKGLFFLPKPFTARDLSRTLREVMDAPPRTPGG